MYTSVKDSWRGEGVVVALRVIIGAGDEAIATRVERTVREWLDVGSEELGEAEGLVGVCSSLSVSLFTSFSSCGLRFFREQRLLPNELVQQHIHVRTGRQPQHGRSAW